MLEKMFSKLAGRKTKAVKIADLGEIKKMETGLLWEMDEPRTGYTQYNARRGDNGSWSISVTQGIPNDQQTTLHNVVWPRPYAGGLTIEQAHNILHDLEEKHPHRVEREYKWSSGGILHYTQFTQAIAQQKLKASLRVSAGRLVKMRNMRGGE